MNHGLSLQINVPGYRIERVLGKGGMATVYLATQMSLGRPVALKVLHDPETPQFFERFFNEGRCIARLNHSNLVAIFDIGQGEGFYYIAMEYLPGGDLKSRIVQGIKPVQALKLLGRLAGCLAYVHDEGVVHRDIKPSNILFRNDGTPVLTDFGIAKLIQTDNDLTVTGTVMGSPHYLSPELAQGIRRVDGRSDLYSLGIILYEMLTGRKPYTADSFAATLMAHIQRPLPQLPDAFAALQPLLDKLLAKQPEERFQSGAELLLTLQALRSRVRLGSLPAEDAVATPGPSPETRALTAATPTPRPHYRRSLYAGLGLLLLLGGFGLRQLTIGGGTAPPAGAEGDRALAAEELAVVAPAGAMSQPAAMEERTAPAATETPPATAGPPPQTGATEPTLAALLEKAQEQLATDHLSYPADDSARYYYSEALKQDPEHPVANRGLDRIADRYAELAQREIDRGRTLRARRHLSQGLAIRPRHERLIRLTNRLNRPAAAPSTEDVFDRLNPDSNR
ncbi:serine/threonine-protein kinase [Sedimenticola hydrogenitrophicus]|uniref:serine/threonine-protein kinase n=1 Tax=Sedimenticola hydrogenitrophicus TaxID=2967975 RepID=UPI0023B0DBB6|nr:serine/threonine-protein kinase [Sedimenticola hydrogenitrophicus]